MDLLKRVVIKRVQNLYKHDIIEISIIVRVWNESDAPELLLCRLITGQGISSNNNCVCPGNDIQMMTLDMIFGLFRENLLATQFI